VRGVSVDSSLNIRTAPNRNDTPVGQIGWDSSEVVRLGETFSSIHGDWVKIQYRNNVGWASADYLNCNTDRDGEVISRATDLVTSLKLRDFDRIASVVHPMKGVRISPYAFIDIEHDQIFYGDEILAIDSNLEEIYWGRYDGSGDPIELSFDQYYEDFIFSRDFTNATYLSIDTAIGRGNTIDNSGDVYPSARMIEYHFPSTDSTSFDWVSLRIILELHEGLWKLVGLINAQWTT